MSEGTAVSPVGENGRSHSCRSGPTPGDGLADRLFQAINTLDIPYCHWKSNFRLSQADSDDDLDLLVDRRCLSRAVSILTGLGFKPAVTRGAATAGVSHFYGMDLHTQGFVHVHLFSRVITGESFIKSHLLPFESLLLDNLGQVGNIRVASRAAELLVCVLRIYIKYGSPLDLIYLSRERQSMNSELRWLRSDNATDEALKLLQKHCPTIEKELFIELLDALREDGSVLRRVLLARRLRKRLRPYAVRRGFRRMWAYVVLLTRYAWRRFTAKRKDKALLSGGAVIALTGPEATGKSTLVAECAGWLGSTFAVQSVHAGKPPSAFLTWPVNLLFPLMRRLLPRFRTTRLQRRGNGPKPASTDHRMKGPAALLYAFAAVIDAWDRRALLIKVRRAAAQGQIVVCDRYPSNIVGAMDSRRLRERSGKGMAASIFNALARLEARLYRDIPPPDAVLRLRVSIETAKQRNQDRQKLGKEDDAYVEARHRNSKGWQGDAMSIQDIDTDMPIDETIRAARQAVWGAI